MRWRTKQRELENLHAYTFTPILCYDKPIVLSSMSQRNFSFTKSRIGIVNRGKLNEDKENCSLNDREQYGIEHKENSRVCDEHAAEEDVRKLQYTDSRASALDVVVIVHNNGCRETRVGGRRLTRLNGRVLRYAALPEDIFSLSIISES